MSEQAKSDAAASLVIMGAGAEPEAAALALEAARALRPSDDKSGQQWAAAIGAACIALGEKNRQAAYGEMFAEAGLDRTHPDIARAIARDDGRNVTELLALQQRNAWRHVLKRLHEDPLIAEGFKRPLKDLLSALIDLDEGRQPEALKPVGSAQDKPGQIYMARAMAVGAVRALRSAGDGKAGAVTVIARKLSSVRPEVLGLLNERDLAGASNPSGRAWMEGKLKAWMGDANRPHDDKRAWPQEARAHMDYINRELTKMRARKDGLRLRALAAELLRTLAAA